MFKVAIVSLVIQRIIIPLLRHLSGVAFIGVLKRDAGAETVEELIGCMEDKGDWSRYR